MITTQKKFLILIGICILVVCTVYSLFQISKSRTFQFFGTIVPNVKTDKKIVALTFDDSPTEKTTDVLVLLDKENIKATFFSIGGAIEEYPAIQKAISDKGHEVGNHTYSHKRMMLVTPQFVKEEIEKTDALIRNSGYKGAIHFRPPYGKKLFALPFYLHQNNRLTIMWDIEPESYPEIAKDKDAIVKHVVENTKQGSIILLHPFGTSDETRKALPEIIKQLKEKGFTFVTISELLKEGQY